MVDVIIPWLNPTEKWFNDYKNYCENENPCRIRDLQTMQPTLKGILKNMPWVRYIWLVVYDEEQIENLNWQELKNKKVKVIYHRDILPVEFLPNFNSVLTETGFYKIKDLADNIIFMNDDMIVNKFIPEEYYFRNNKPVHHKTIKNGQRTKQANMWDKILLNTQKICNTLTDKRCVVDTWHMPCPVSKNMLKFIEYKKHNELYESCVNARIRKPYSIDVIELSYWLDEIFNLCEFDNIYNKLKTKFLVLSNKTTDKEIENSTTFDIIVLNDSEDLSNEQAEKIKTLISKKYNK